MSNVNAVIWFRRDLRTADHPAFEHAIRHATQRGGTVLALFVVDDLLSARSGPNRLAYLYRNLRSLRESGLPLIVRCGDPRIVVTELASTHAAEVFVTGDAAPYGQQRDAEVSKSLVERGSVLHVVDSNYVVAPGTILKGDGTPYKVFTPFSKVWLTHAVGQQPSPRIKLSVIPWTRDVELGAIPQDPSGVAPQLPEAGESHAWQRVRTFVDESMHAYETIRNNPGADRTSRLSADLKFGALHPRQLLPYITDSPNTGTDVFRSELCWREFYADVLFVRPDTIRHPFMSAMSNIEVDHGDLADERFEAWCEGRTGYPFIDAGMRQLLHEGWMHNRVRMATASFLVKDLHLPWQRGARWFMRHLVDGDVASNQHGWQWTAGTGTDASPYYRVFNPTTQGQKFDPDGVYVRRWIPELADVSGKTIHLLRTPNPLGNLWGSTGYPAPIVDHADERVVALDRYAATRTG